MFESTTNELLAAILAGIVIWFITGVVTFFLQRYSLEKALIEDINHRRSNLKEPKEFLEAYFKKYVKKGGKISRHARFTKEEFPFYEDVRKDLYKYFGAANLIAIMRCYEALEEIEILMDGIIKDFGSFAEKKKTLTAFDVEYLEAKKNRILNIIDILRQEKFKKVSDIPRDYEGRISSVDVIARL